MSPKSIKDQLNGAGGLAGSPKMRALCRAAHDHIMYLESKAEKEGKRADRLYDLVDRLIGEIVVPKPNCSCCVSPPCRDCVEFAGIRELLEQAAAALKETAITPPVKE